MKQFDSRNFGTVIDQVKQDIGATIDYYIKHNLQQELLNFIVGELKSSVIKKDLTKTLAIIDYVTHNSDIVGSQLPITQNIDNTESLCDIAYSNGDSELAIELSGLCQALHYIDAE